MKSPNYLKNFSDYPGQYIKQTLRVFTGEIRSMVRSLNHQAELASAPNSDRGGKAAKNKHEELADILLDLQKLTASNSNHQGSNNLAKDTQKDGNVGGESEGVEVQIERIVENFIAHSRSSPSLFNEKALSVLDRLIMLSDAPKQHKAILEYVDFQFAHLLRANQTSSNLELKMIQFLHAIVRNDKLDTGLFIVFSLRTLCEILINTRSPINKNVCKATLTQIFDDCIEMSNCQATLWQWVCKILRPPTCPSEIKNFLLDSIAALLETHEAVFKKHLKQSLCAELMPSLEQGVLQESTKSTDQLEKVLRLLRVICCKHMAGNQLLISSLISHYTSQRALETEGEQMIIVFLDDHLFSNHDLITFLFHTIDMDILQDSLIPQIFNFLKAAMKKKKKQQSLKQDKLYESISNCLSSLFRVIRSVQLDQNASQSKFDQLLVQKRALEKCTQVFCDSNAFLGIELAINSGFIANTDPANIARWLRECHAVRGSSAVGQYLGSPNNRNVLCQYVRTFDMKNVSFVTGFRTFLGTFKIPGESQIIERILEEWSQWFWECNGEGGGDGVLSPDQYFQLAYSALMLNTDHHNGQVKDKMTIEQFRKNTLDALGVPLENNENLKQILDAIFEEISIQEIQLSSIQAFVEYREDVCKDSVLDHSLLVYGNAVNMAQCAILLIESVEGRGFIATCQFDNLFALLETISKCDWGASITISVIDHLVAMKGSGAQTRILYKIINQLDTLRLESFKSIVGCLADQSKKASSSADNEAAVCKDPAALVVTNLSSQSIVFLLSSLLGLAADCDEFKMRILDQLEAVDIEIVKEALFDAKLAHLLPKSLQDQHVLAKVYTAMIARIPSLLPRLPPTAFTNAVRILEFFGMSRQPLVSSGIIESISSCLSAACQSQVSDEDFMSKSFYLFNVLGRMGTRHVDESQRLLALQNIFHILHASTFSNTCHRLIWKSIVSPALEDIEGSSRDYLFLLDASISLYPKYAVADEPELNVLSLLLQHCSDQSRFSMDADVKILELGLNNLLNLCRGCMSIWKHRSWSLVLDRFDLIFATFAVDDLDEVEDWILCNEDLQSVSLTDLTMDESGGKEIISPRINLSSKTISLPIKGNNGGKVDIELKISLIAQKFSIQLLSLNMISNLIPDVFGHLKDGAQRQQFLSLIESSRRQARKFNGNVCIRERMVKSLYGQNIDQIMLIRQVSVSTLLLLKSYHYVARDDGGEEEQVERGAFSSYLRFSLDTLHEFIDMTGKDKRRIGKGWLECAKVCLEQWTDCIDEICASRDAKLEIANVCVDLCLANGSSPLLSNRIRDDGKSLVECAKEIIIKLVHSR